MTTEERLEQVERELARAKRGMRRGVIAGAVLLACLVLAAAQSSRPVADVVTAREFVLVDENGTMRAALTTNKTGIVWFALLDDVGARVVLALDKDGPRLTMSDENAKMRAAMCVVKRPSVISGPSIYLYDAEGADLFRTPYEKQETRTADGPTWTAPRE